MSDQGDLHNFGQYVRAVTRASGNYFQKPRPVYWEWFFFGKTSPLVPFFSAKNLEAISPAECLFQLEVEFDESLSGYSRQVLPSNSSQVDSSHAYSLGVLLAYCYIFGIRDLHRHNLIRTDSHLQVIDAEVVLVNLLLPNETLLLPFKEIGPDLAGIGHLGLNPIVPIETLLTILNGYSDVFKCVSENLRDIQTVFFSRRNETTRVPIRHIVRDTVKYREWKGTSSEISFFADELRQLERGDIPYFFKFIGDPLLYQYTNLAGKFSPVTVPADFLKAVARDATDPEILLKRERIEDSLSPTGFLFLVKRLLDPAFVGELKVREIILSQNSDSIFATIKNRRFSASRS